MIYLQPPDLAAAAPAAHLALHLDLEARLDEGKKPVRILVVTGRPNVVSRIVSTRDFPVVSFAVVHQLLRLGKEPSAQRTRLVDDPRGW